MRCHHCEERLKEVKRGSILLNICPSCEGIAVDHTNFKKLLLKMDRVAEVREVKSSKIDIMRYTKQKEPIALCPKCNYNIYSIESDNLNLDYCINCKTFWFDKGELSILIQRYNNGSKLILESSKYSDNSIINLIFSIL